MSNKHTELPWGIELTWSFHTITGPCGDEVAEVMTGADGELCDADQGHDLIEQNKANARLIVTAVNYHHRLREALRSVDWDKAADWGVVDMDDRDIACALLAELDNLEK